MSGNPEIMIVAGEPSADRHGAEVVRTLKRLLPEVEVWGMGGTFMREAGVRVVKDISEISVVGITEVVWHIRAILEAKKALMEAFDRNPPLLTILIDFPDFNLRLANEIKKRGGIILYYIAPQVWAWRRGRLKEIARVVDFLGVILPFEEDFFRRAGIRAEFVGHPLMEELPFGITKLEAKEILGIGEGKKVLGLLPGSRSVEIRRMLPVMLEASKEIIRKADGIVPIVALPRGTDPARFHEMVKKSCPEALVTSGRSHVVLAASEAAAVASGTATLEAALLRTPIVVAYKASWLSYFLARLLVKVPHISLVNILAKEEVVPELIQGKFKPKALRTELLSLMEDGGKRGRMIQAMTNIKEMLGEKKASLSIALAALNIIGEKCFSPLMSR